MRPKAPQALPFDVTFSRRLLALLVASLLVGTLMPGSLKDEIEHHFWQVLPWSGMAHFVLFCAIAAVPAYGRGWGALCAAMMLALLLAVSTETLQHWIPGRHPRLFDVWLDLTGALIGCALQVRMRNLRCFSQNLTRSDGR